MGKGRRFSLIVLLALCAALLAVPSVAAAEVIKIDSAADEAKAPAATTCESAAGKCTLRAAVEIANSNSQFDVIEFDATVFNGEVGADEVQLNEAVEIATPMTIVGHPVFGGPFVTPNAGVTAKAGEAALIVASNGVTVEDLAFNGGKFGITVVGHSTGFKAKGSWFGLKLDASAAAISQAGISIGPGSDEATIGGTTADERNVFTNATFGVLVGGASKAKIRGNYIGVGPTGTGAASLEYGVGIYSLVGFSAKEDEVGGVLGASEAGTSACDGPCDVIAATDTGIDLGGVEFPASGFEPAGGPTKIRGNYLGLAADGSDSITGTAGTLISAGLGTGEVAGPGQVTVGGALASTEGNYFSGGENAISASHASGLEVRGNHFGYTASGTPATPAEAETMLLINEGITATPVVTGNSIEAGHSLFAINNVGPGADIAGNKIVGGTYGIKANGNDEGIGSVISSNQLIEQDWAGLDIVTDSNVVIGNSISRAGRSAIVIETDADHNRIGGDELGEANTLIETEGPEPEDAAITIFGRETGRNEVAANTGFANPGAFIKLMPHGGSEKPNGGIQPPVLATVRQSSVAGTAAPNATVRLFTKASAEPGELGTYLGKVVADGSGAWNATIAKQPVGTLIAATATSAAGTPEAGTSAVSSPVAALADPGAPSGGGGASAGGSTGPAPQPTPPPAPAKKPTVKITASPKKSSASTTATFKFKAQPAAGATFECKLDAAKWAKCRSPKTYKELKPGSHTFSVRAKANGLTGAATVFKFTVKA